MKNKYLLLTIVLMSSAFMATIEAKAADLSSSLNGIFGKAKAAIKKHAPALVNKGKELTCNKICAQCQASVAKDKAASKTA